MGMHHDNYLYDTERLHSIASDELVKKGLHYVTENRAIGVALENGCVVAQVEVINEEQYWLELLDKQGSGLTVTCDCHTEQIVCVHVIAALYAYAASMRTQRLFH